MCQCSQIPWGPPDSCISRSWTISPFCWSWASTLDTLGPTKKRDSLAGTFTVEILVTDKTRLGGNRRIRSAQEHISTILNLGKENTDSHKIFCSYHYIVLPIWVNLRKSSGRHTMTLSRAGTLWKHSWIPFSRAALQILQYFHLAMSSGLGVLSCPHLSSQYPAMTNAVLQRSIKSRLSKGIHGAAQRGMDSRAAVMNP